MPSEEHQTTTLLQASVKHPPASSHSLPYTYMPCRGTLAAYSSPFHKPTAPTSALHHISYNVRMRDFAAYTATCISLLLVSTAFRVAIAELRHEPVHCCVVCGIGIGAQQAGEVVDVPACEAEEGESFCRVSEDRHGGGKG